MWNKNLFTLNKFAKQNYHATTNFVRSQKMTEEKLVQKLKKFK